MAVVSKRTFGLHGPLTYDQLNQLSTLELIQLHNAKSEKQIKVFHTKAKGMNKVWELYAAEEVVENNPPAENADGGANGIETTTEASDMAKKTKAPKAKKAGGGTRIPADATIKVLAKENPYKKGTKAYATFELFGKSKTVAEFREKASDKDRFDPGYIKYSSRDGYIKIG